MSDIPEDAAERARRYIKNFERALKGVKPVSVDAMVNVQGIEKVSDTMGRYLNDARFYLQNGKPVTALASIAYAEGLLDALSFLKLAEPGDIA